MCIHVDDGPGVFIPTKPTDFFKNSEASQRPVCTRSLPEEEISIQKVLCPHKARTPGGAASGMNFAFRGAGESPHSAAEAPSEIDRFDSASACPTLRIDYVK